MSNSLPYVHFTDQTSIDSPLAIGLNEPEALDASVAGTRGSLLAVLDSQGVVTARTSILTTEAGAALAELDHERTHPLFGQATDDEPPVFQALREAWSLAGHGGLTPVWIYRSDDSLSCRPTPARDWPRFVREVITLSRIDSPTDRRALIVQSVVEHHTAVLVERSATPDSIDVHLAEDAKGGSVTLNRSGVVEATGKLSSVARQRLGFGDRIRTRSFHGDVNTILDQQVEPMRLLALVDDHGLDAIAGVEPAQSS